MIDVLYSFPLRVGVTGIGMTAWNQVNSLIKQGVRVHLCCGSLEKPINGLSSLYETLKPLGIKLPIRPIGNLRAAKTHDLLVSGYLKRMKGRITVLHCWPSGSLRTLAVAKALSIPSFLERPNCHTRFAYQVVQDEYQKLGMRAALSDSHAFDGNRLKREEQEYVDADYLLCPSDFVKKSFALTGFAEGKLLRHQYGCDAEKFSVNTNLDADAPLCLSFVGQCGPRKGLHYALQAWLASDACHDGRFLIFGRFIDGYDDVLKAQLSHPSVDYRGFSADVSEAFQQSHAMVLSSVEEGSALVTYEARCSGAVLLVSDATGAVCVHGKNALVHPAGGWQLLAEHINAIHSDRHYYRQLRQASLDERGTLSWFYSATVLLECYRYGLGLKG